MFKGLLVPAAALPLSPIGAAAPRSCNLASDNCEGYAWAGPTSQPFDGGIQSRRFATRRDDPAYAIGQSAQTVLTSVSLFSSTASVSIVRSRMRSAAAFASGPVSPIGPTQPGQPFSHSHSAIRRHSRSYCGSAERTPLIGVKFQRRTCFVAGNPFFYTSHFHSWSRSCFQSKTRFPLPPTSPTNSATP